MPIPRLGDVIVRTAVDAASFVVLEPATQKLLSGPHGSLTEAVEAANDLVHGDGRVWQQNVDARGRPLGPPILVPPLPRIRP